MPPHMNEKVGLWGCARLECAHAIRNATALTRAHLEARIRGNTLMPRVGQADAASTRSVREREGNFGSTNMVTDHEPHA